MLKKIAVFGVATLMSAGAAFAQPQQGPGSTDERMNVQTTPSMQSQGIEGDRDVIHTTTVETVEVLRPVMTPTTGESQHWQYFERGFTTPIIGESETIESRLEFSTDSDNFVTLPETSEADVINSMDSWDTVGTDDDDVIIQQRLEITPSDVDQTLMIDSQPIEQDIILERRTQIETTTPVEVDITPRHDVDVDIQ
jgi:hypothetical protein